MSWAMTWHWKLYRDEQFSMEVGMEFHVAGELWLKARRPTSVDRLTLPISARKTTDGYAFYYICSQL